MTALNLSPLPCVRTEKLAAMYGTRFELRYPPKLTLLNYGYPDLLDRTRRAMNWGIFHHHQVCDVDSANFAYAGALQAFFHPSYLVGTEVDGHPLYCNEQSRNNDAHGHIQALPHTNYIVTDYRQYKQPRRNYPCLGSLRHSQTAPGLALVLEVVRSGCPICSHRLSPPMLDKYLLLGIELWLKGDVLRQGNFLFSYSQPGNGLARQSKAAA